MRPLTTNDKAPSIYVWQQNCLRHFELSMHWILTTQGGSLYYTYLVLPEKCADCISFRFSHTVMYLLLLLLTAIKYKIETSLCVVETEIDAK